MQTESRYCPSCQDETLFETPDCLEGHGHDCPERLCSACGSAAFASQWPELASEVAAGSGMERAQWSGHRAA